MINLECCQGCTNPEAQAHALRVRVAMRNSTVALQSEERRHLETKKEYGRRIAEKDREIEMLKRKLQVQAGKHGYWKRKAKAIPV